MKHIVKTSLLCLALLTCSAAYAAVPLGYFSQAVPDGISSGWTYPDGWKSSLGDAVLTGPASVYALFHKSGERDSLSLIDTYQQDVNVFSADVDGDSRADLIVAFTQSQSIRLITGQSSGRQFKDLLIGNLKVVSAGAARINSDSLPDLVLAGSDSIKIFTRISPDSVTGLQYRYFATVNVNTPASNHPLKATKLLFGDFDGDLHVDMVYNGFIYINRGKGAFYSQQLPSPAGQKIKLLEMAGDFDGDRRAELLWTSAAGAFDPVTVSVADYNSASIFLPSILLKTGLQDVTSAFRYDANGDGNLELMFYSKPDQRAVEFSGSSSGITANSLHDLFSLTSVRGNLLGPLGPAGAAEPGWLFHDTVGDSLHVGFTMRPYADATQSAGLADSLGVAGVSVAVGDYDIDGRLDFYVVNADGPNRLYRGEANGRFNEVAAQAGVTQGNDGISAAWGDYNNDGYPDLILAGLSLPDKLFFNRGNGTFADSSQVLNYSRGSQRATSASWGDVNRDGYLDLLITSFDGANRLLMNRGGRYFEDASSSLGPTDNYYHTENASLIDVDRDGWLDIVLLNSDGPARLIMGASNGQWRDVTATSGFNTASQYPVFGQNQSWGDFNGDGYPDLFITRAADNCELLLNNGLNAQTRFNRVYLGKPGNGTYGRLGSVADDFDSDGLTDLLITRTELYNNNQEIARNLVYLGDAKGYPDIESGEASTSNRPGDLLVAPLRFTSPTSLPVAGDFDGDGDIDLLYVNYLPENPNDLFHGSALPLRLMRNGSSHSNTLTVVMRRSDKKNIAGTAVVLYRGGRGYWKMVSGGGGRIQTGPFITFSFGNSASADSMSISWPDGVKQKIVGPLYPGKLELEVDLTAPKLEFVTWPGDKVEGGTLVATRVPLNGVLQVTDNSQISRLQVIVRTPLTGREDTLRLTDKISNGKAAVSFAGPLPGDSLFYYCVAIDIYNNKSRLPAAQNEYYRLRAEPGVLKGDVDGDLQVNFNDVLRLLALIKNNQSLPSQAELKAGDLNSDGKLDIFDVISLLALIKQVNPGTNVQASFD